MTEPGFACGCLPVLNGQGTSYTLAISCDTHREQLANGTTALTFTAAPASPAWHLDVPAYGTPPTGGSTWDITWDRCPTCPAPVMPDQDHTCLTSPDAEHDREDIRSYETGAIVRTVPTDHVIHHGPVDIVNMNNT